MAQTGYTPILIYSSSTASNAPAVGNLTNSTLGSELAINITDGKLFYKDNANAIQVIGWKVTPATAGGTGQTSYAVGDILYANTTTTLAKLADVATGNALISGGVGVAPAWGKIGLTTHVSGTLPIANGGTAQTSFTANYIHYGSFSTSANLQFNGTTLGVGGTLSAWSGVGFVVQTPGPSMWGSSAVGHISRNTYFDGSNYRYLTTDFVEDYYQLAGAQVFRVAASGTAGNIVSGFTNQLYLHPSSGVSIGNTTDPGATNLSVSGTTNTASGTQSALNATATTIYTMPTLPQGLYVVQAALGNNAPATFTAVSLITQGNGTSRATALATATNMTISVSGLNIQATQSAGGTATISWSVFRIA
jgi:hypothetical protein